jgi:hypothetical protein
MSSFGRPSTKSTGSRTRATSAPRFSTAKSPASRGLTTSRMTSTSNRPSSAGPYNSNVNKRNTGVQHSPEVILQQKQVIVQFVKENSIKLGATEPSKFKERDVDGLNMLQFCNIFEVIMQKCFDPGFKLSDETKDANLQKPSDKAANLERYKRAYINGLKMLDYPYTSHVEPILDRNKSSLTSLSSTAKGHAIYSLAYLIQFSNVCFSLLLLYFFLKLLELCFG